LTPGSRSALVALCLASPLAWAQRGLEADLAILDQSRLVASGERVAIHQGNIAVEPAFLQLAEEAYRRLESLTGRGSAVAALGPKIHIYVSDMRAPSHVWRGYDHPGDPRPLVFLNRRAYEGAMRGENATYAHEMAHLFTWRYSSHSLREGLADYLALQIHPGAAVGPNTAGFESAPVPVEVTPYLGTRLPPPPPVVSDESFRRGYYAASYRFVKLLVARAGMETFLKLYDSADPEAEYAGLYGASRQDLVREALR
jgi:hypothetical protein